MQGSVQRYRALVADLLGTGVLLDEAMAYFDARLSARYPTVEVRVADVCLRAEDTVLIAALCRGLVETAARDARAGQDAPGGTSGPDPARSVAGRPLRHRGRAGAPRGLESPTRARGDR